MLNLIKLIVLIVLYCHHIAAATDCQIPIGSKVDWKVFWPLAFRLNGSLYPTTQSDDGNDLSVWIPKNEELYLSCGPNYISALADKRVESMKVKCSDNGKFLISNDVLKSAKDFKCDLRTIEEVLVPVHNCHKPATSGQFGYVHPLDNSVRIIGESCYNIDDGRTLFAHVKMGLADDSIVTEVLSKEFFRKPHPSSSYRMDFLYGIRVDLFNEQLEKLLGTEEPLPGYQIANFIDAKYLLNNQQLLQTQKLVWNYFPLHDKIVGNLQLLKADIAELAKTHDDIDVYVGSHGITKLPNSKGAHVPIYLNNDIKQFPIPEIIWFVVKKDHKAAAFGVVNNPSAAIKMTIESPCKKSKCSTISWLENVRAAEMSSDSFNDDAIVCCDYDEFRGIVKEVPRMPDVTEFFI